MSQSLEVDFGPVSSLKFSNSGCFIGCGSTESGGGMEIWDIRSQGLVRESPVGSRVNCLAFSASDHVLFAGLEGSIARMSVLEVKKVVTSLKMDGWGGSRVWDMINLQDTDVMKTATVLQSSNICVNDFDSQSEWQELEVKPVEETVGVKLRAADDMFDHGRGEDPLRDHEMSREETAKTDYSTPARSNKADFTETAPIDDVVSPQEATVCDQDQDNLDQDTLLDTNGVTRTPPPAEPETEVLQSSDSSQMWDGESTELEEGLTFPSRNQVKVFMTKYMAAKRVKFCVVSGR